MAQEKVTSVEAMRKYFESTRFRTRDIDPDTLKMVIPNGLNTTVIRDLVDVVMTNDFEIEGATYGSGNISPDLGFEVGLVVGAAMQKEGTLPGQYHELVEMISVPKMDSSSRLTASQRYERTGRV